MSLRKPPRKNEAGRRLVLRFNPRVGRDPLPRIRELTAGLSLEVREEAASGKSSRVVSVSGDPARLDELERMLLRFPSITVKSWPRGNPQ